MTDPQQDAGPSRRPHAWGGSRIDQRLGFHRVDGVRDGWIDDAGAPVTDEPTVARLRGLTIPPAWVHVWAAGDPADRVQATGVDARGRTQYRYAETAVAQASEQKFAHVLAFAAALPDLRTRVAVDLAIRMAGDDHLPASQVVATIIRLLDRGLFRVGNERYAREDHTYGITTIRRRHLLVRGDEVVVDFVGKEHRPLHVSVVDAAAARVLTGLLNRPGPADGELFLAAGPHGPRPVHSTEVNAYLHAHTRAPATAKVFRTWGATSVAAAVVGGARSTVRGARTVETSAIRAAADLLGNTPAVARASYVHPAAFSAGRSAGVVTAVDLAAARLASRDVRHLFGEPAVQAAVLDALRETSDRV